MKSSCGALILSVIARALMAASGENDAVVSRIHRGPVISKAIASIGYSQRLHILEIEFLNGAIYRYFEVAPSVYRDLISFGSKAHYYDANIKGNYRSLRIRSWLKQDPR
jgi:hypothetical protein